MMNIVFLDFDGVLNCRYTKEKWKGWAGLEDEKIRLLKGLADETGSIIVLTSSWRLSWSYASYMEPESSTGNYIYRQFKKNGLKISSKTESLGGRGKEIRDWLDKFPHGNWIVLDDDCFDDFEEYGIMDHLIKTDFDKGLTEADVKRAKDILNR